MNVPNVIEKISQNEEHKEGPVAVAIESKTAKLPSDVFLWLALGSIGVSAALQARGRKNESTFVGQWAPTFLILGLYNKIVKLAGSQSPANSLSSGSSASSDSSEKSGSSSPRRVSQREAY